MLAHPLTCADPARLRQPIHHRRAAPQRLTLTCSRVTTRRPAGRRPTVRPSLVRRHRHFGRADVSTRSTVSPARHREASSAVRSRPSAPSRRTVGRIPASSASRPATSPSSGARHGTKHGADLDTWPAAAAAGRSVRFVAAGRLGHDPAAASAASLVVELRRPTRSMHVSDARPRRLGRRGRRQRRHQFQSIDHPWSHPVAGRFRCCRMPLNSVVATPGAARSFV